MQLGQLEELKFQLSEILPCGQHLEHGHFGMEDQTLGGRAFHERIGSRAMIGLGESEPRGAVALGIVIHQQHELFHHRQRSREIDGGRGLADATLLIGQYNDACGHPRPRSGGTEGQQSAEWLLGSLGILRA